MARSRTAAGSFLRSSWISGPLAAIFAVTLAGVVAGDPPSGNDLFTGRVEHGTGAFRTALGTVLITISLGDSTRASRPLTLTFAGTPCAPGGTACIVLDGIAHGRATPQGSIPDTGEILRLHARGTVSPLRRVRITGTVHGTGFVFSGREMMALSIADRRGTIMLTAESEPVPGFTSP